MEPWEEFELLTYLRARRGQEVRFWTVINELSKQMDPRKFKLRRQQLVAALPALLRAKKIIRNKKNNTLRINEVFA
jgi:hypothetical protein